MGVMFSMQNQTNPAEAIEKNRAALVFQRVSKQYASGQWANRDIDLTFSTGQIVGILGPNGAGKTTLLRQLVGLTRPTQGKILLFGEQIQPGQRRVRETITYLPQHPLALGDLRVEEAIRFSALLRGFPGEVAWERTQHLLEVLDLMSLRRRLVGQLSGGEHRLVSIASVLVAPTPVVALDEPTNELDPLMRRRVWQLIGQLRDERRLVLLVSHNVLEAETVLDRVVILASGQVIRNASPEDIRAEVGSFVRVTLQVGLHLEQWAQQVAQAAGAKPEIEGNQLRFHLPRSQAISLMGKWLKDSGPQDIIGIEVTEPSLEEMYLQIRQSVHLDATTKEVQ